MTRRVCAPALLLLGLLPARAQEDPLASGLVVPAPLLEAAARSLVPVHLHLKPVEGEESEDYRSPAQRYQSYVRDRIPLETAGLVLDREGRVLIVDTQPDLRFLDRIEIRPPGGAAVPARIEAILRTAPGIVLRAEKADGLVPAGFSEAPAIDRAARLFGASLYRDEGGWTVWARRMGPLFAPGEAGPPRAFSFGGVRLEYLDSVDPPPPFLIASHEAGVFGVSFFNRIDLDGRCGFWRGRDLAAASGPSPEDLEKLLKGLEEAWGKAFPRVTIRYRPERADEGSAPGLRRFFPVRYGGAQEDEGALETTDAGIALSADRVLIPRAIDRKRAARIDAIEVEAGGRTFEASFAGALEEWHGFLVETKGPLPLHLGAGRAAPLPRADLTLAFRAEEKYGRTLMTLQPTRFLGVERGADGAQIPASQRPLKPGTWIVSEEGAPIGLHLAPRRVEEEQEDAAQAGSQGMRASYDWHRPWSRHLPWAEAVALAGTGARIDPTTVARAKGEEERRVWLGVETSPMTRELAKNLKLRVETRDGELGLIVNAVYEGSPAAAAGLREGDVLLRLLPSGRRHPLELWARGTESPHSSFHFPGMEEGMEAMGYQVPERCPWPGQDNHLNRVLGSLGAGREVEVHVLREGRAETLSARLETAPHDQESAPRYAQREVGLTVRDVTFEVRRALKLEKDQAAVVISKVEPGSPSAQARLRVYELITEVDGEPVGSTPVFQKLLEAAIAAGKPSFKLTVLRLGRSRFADLKLEK